MTRRDPAAATACAPAPTSRRTSSRSPSASASTTRTSPTPSVRRGRRARRARAAATVDRTLRGRRRRHAVRGADRRRLRRAGRAPASRSPSSRRGSAGATTRRTSSRSEVQVLTNVGARAHALARADDHRHRRGEARRRAAGRHARRRARPAPRRAAPSPSASAPSAAAHARRGAPPTRASPVLARRAFQRRNFALAARRRRGVPRRRSTTRRSRAAAAATTRARAASRSSRTDPADDPRRRPQPGRHAQRSPRRCARSLDGRPLVAVLSILDDKDAGGDARASCCRSATSSMLTRTREPARAAARRRSPRSCGQLAAGRRRASSPSRTPRWPPPARPPGADGVVLATGSIYLIADLLRAAGRRGGRRCERRRRPLGRGDGRWRSRSIVALVILVFFALGYGFGRLFL